MLTMNFINCFRNHQKPSETFDVFSNRVKQEAKGCEFSCSNTCTIRDVLIRDQIIVGTLDDDIRKMALYKQWSLKALLSEGRKLEAASFGAHMIKHEWGEAEVARLRQPGKYSKKREKQNTKSEQRCINCSSKFCSNGIKCPAHDRVFYLW